MLLGEWTLAAGVRDEDRWTCPLGETEARPYGRLSFQDSEFKISYSSVITCTHAHSHVCAVGRRQPSPPP